MLKFVHTKPPRAKSTSPAGSTGSADRSSSPRHRDRGGGSDTVTTTARPYPPPFPPGAHREGEAAGYSLPRGRTEHRGGGRSSPGTPASSRTSPGLPSAVDLPPQPPRPTSADGRYDHSVGSGFSGTLPPAAVARGGRITFPDESEFVGVGKFPVVTSVTRARDGGDTLVERAAGDRERERTRDREKESGASREGRARTSSPRDRHVRIAPYPPEEILYGARRPSPFPVVADKDRSDSPSLAYSTGGTHPPPHSILSSKQPRLERAEPIFVTLGCRDSPTRRVDVVDFPESPGGRYAREKQWGLSEGQVTAGSVGTLWTPIDPAASGLAQTWAQPQCTVPTTTTSRAAAAAASAGGAKGQKGREPGDKGREVDARGKTTGPSEGGDSAAGGGGAGRDRFWKPKLFFSGSWLHGPSRHRIFATKSAQPQPTPSPVMTTCVPQVSNDLSNEALNKPQSARSVGQSSQGSRGIMSSLRDMLNRSQDGADELLLDVTYVTERIISMSFPSEGHDTTYAFNLKDVVRMLKTKHGDNYLVLNLSEKRQDLVKANAQVKEYGWPDHLAPPLERLCSVCKAIDAWLNADPRNVAVLHCKGGRARIAIIIAAYMHYSNICASADQALERVAMKRFYDDKLGGLPLPSQRRYVHYFAGLLSGAIKINSNPLYLHHILIHGVPNFDTRGGCRPFIKVYQGMQPIFTSGVYNVTDNMQKVCISISPGIPLRGDILIKCYHKKARSGQREAIWQCQFHTCAIQDNNVVFSKQELDDGIHDPRFPDNGKVEFVFGPSSDSTVSVSGFKSDVTVPVDDNEDSLTRSDSYENFHRALAASYAGPRDTSYGSQQHQQHQAEAFSSSHTTHVNQQRTAYNTSTLNRTSDDHINYNSVPRQPVSVDERSQLDELLSDLLSDQVIVSPTSPRSPQGQTSPNTMSGAKTVTTTTHTYSTYSSTDSGAGGRVNPADKVLIQRAEVTYKVPGQGEERHHYTIAGEPPELEKPRVPKGAFSYTPVSPSQTDQSRTFQSLERDMNRAEHTVTHSSLQQTQHGQQSPPSRMHTLPYRADYENRYNTSEIQQYNTLDSDQASWLQQQQEKLQRMRDGRDPSGRTEQEKQLVQELRFAQKSYYNKRAHSEAEEQALMDSYNQPPGQVHNGPITPASAPPSYAPPPRGFGGDTGHFNTFSQSSHQYSEGHHAGGNERSSNKPPPSPTMQRSVTSTAVPIQPPVRTSSKDYMRSRSNSSGNTWQASPPSNRPLARQYSDTLYDREHGPNMQARHTPSYTTPPHSPRLSPTHAMGPTATTTYTTYRTIHKDVRDEPMREQKQPVQQAKAPPPVQAPPPQQQPQPVSQSHHNYITEVFVHRVGGEKQPKDKVDAMDDTRLDSLTRSLQAATESIMEDRMSNVSQQQLQQPIPVQQHQQQPIPVQQLQQQPISVQQHQQQQSYQQSWSEHYQTSSQVQKQEQGPPPKPVSVIEEDRITLRPIGPGVQTLEPENTHASTSTLNRATTPSFPTSPVTPPFPVSSRMHSNTGGSTIVSPTGTLQTVQHQQLQYQTHSQHQQQHHQQHHQQQASDGTLHIDTSNRMLAPNQARSPGSAGSPPSPGNLNTLRQQLSAAHSISGSVVSPHSLTGQSSPSVYFGLSRRGSLSSLADSDMVHTTPRFVKDTSKYWYKPNITREDAIVLLKDKAPGTFVIRDSNSFPGAFGLALKVAQIPANVQAKPTNDPQAELVRHFLIEPTPKGVRLRGCSNEPVFGSLASLVYQHSITPLALPCKLSLPDAGDTVDGPVSPEMASPTELNSAADLLAKGAACNVVFINTVDTESLTGPQAIAKAIKSTIESQPALKTTIVHFKVSSQGITLTDNNRKLFFRRHYPVAAVTYCGMDPQDRRWKRDPDNPNALADSKIFGFVARKQGGGSDNSCHLFAELDPEQPASAIVNFVTKVMIGQTKIKS